jgi:hypothetical protein
MSSNVSSSGTFSRNMSSGLLIPMNSKSRPQDVPANMDRASRGRTFVTPNHDCTGYKTENRNPGKATYEDSQRTTMGPNSYPQDSQMTCMELPSSFGSQNCSQHDSQASAGEEAVLSQHRLPPFYPPGSQTSFSAGNRGSDRFESSSTPRALTPISNSGRSDAFKSGNPQDHRPPKAPNWNLNLIKRAASPVTCFPMSLI